MPILNVEIIGEVTSREGLAQRIADAAGDALGTRSRGTWAKLHFIDESLYAENAGQHDKEVKPVFASVLQAHPPTGEKLQEQIAALTEAISQATGRAAENVHVIFESPAAGRIAFGGKLRS